MRDFYELINKYPMTTILLVIAIYCIINSFGEAINKNK